MKTKLAAGVLTLATAIPAFALSRVIWPDPPGAPVPPPWLLPFFWFQPSSRGWPSGWESPSSSSAAA